MPDPKSSSNAPITRDMSSVRDLIPAPPAPPPPAPPVGGQVLRARPSRRPSSESGQGINAQFVLGAMRRWWKVALPIALVLAAGAVFIVYYTFVPQYEAAATLEILESPGYIAFDHGGGISATYFQTQLELIGGRWTIDRVLDSEKIKQLPELREQRDPSDYLMKHIRVARRGGSDLLDIRYSSPDKDNAALVVNEITRQYLRKTG